MKDTNKHKGLRNQLVKQLQDKGITDKSVLNAIAEIPRHLFLNSSFEDFAYLTHGAATGPYWWAFYAIIFCNLVFPALFWFKKIRTNINRRFG